MLPDFVFDLFIVLAAGFLAALVCRKLNVPTLVGYLLVGAAIGDGGFGLVSNNSHELHHLSEAGVFLLLFAIGLEFSLDELLRLGRHLVIGGGVQMVLAAAPIAGLMIALGAKPATATLVSLALAFSSTVLVFKSLAERGQTVTRHGRRAVGILLFQDAALAPLLLLIPLLTGSAEVAAGPQIAKMAITSLACVGVVIIGRRLMAEHVAPRLAGYRSPELLVLFTIVTLLGATVAATIVNLPPALGAFAAGLLFSGNRWSEQIDALTFPFRETFAAVFFVSLGALFDSQLAMREPLVLLGGVAGVVVLKAIAAAIALRCTRMQWPDSFATGLGLAHVGEFAFVLLLVAFEAELIDEPLYHRLVVISLGTLFLAPLLLRVGFGRLSNIESEQSEIVGPRLFVDSPEHGALVFGLGPIGRAVSSQLEMQGYDVCLVDRSPINLQGYAQQGFRTVAGEAESPETLAAAGVTSAEVAFVCLPDDDLTLALVSTLRRMHPTLKIFARCRYTASAKKLRAAGANDLVVEEAEAANELVALVARKG